VIVRRQRPIQNIEDSVYEELREGIFNGSLPPGEAIVLADYAEQLGVSTMPVRASLGRLQSEGLVRQLRHRGFIVTPLELEDFEEIQAIRAGIEALAARLGAEKIDDAGVHRMKFLLEQLKRVSLSGKVEDYLRAEWEYHAACYHATKRDRLVQLVEDHRRRAERYLRLAVASSPGFQTPLVFQERLLDVSVKHDGHGAESLIREALEWSALQVGEQLKVDR
jgi:DNA-binding GntR family transcriptional regulator